MRYKSIPIVSVYAALLIAVAAAFSACNAQKKNTAAARQYTGFITKYNIMYNGDTHFKETLKDMESKYEDDYSRMVLMHPAEARTDEKAPQPSGDFKRSIEKAQKAIQIRSIKNKPPKKSGKGNDPEYKAWMKRDEYNPVLHNAWMLMGRSQYYNGDFLGAASTFYYVSKHFTWLPATVTDAKLWQALCYVSLDWLYEAELIITRIKPDELVNSSLRQMYNFTYADFLIRSKEYEKALPYLKAAIDGADGAQKTRLRFLLGQVYASLGDKERAYDAFKKAGSSFSAPYRTKFNARIKQSEVFSGPNIEPEIKSLLSMVKYDRNKEYLDQIYYAVGNLYLSRKDTANAIANYELGVEKSTRGGIDKALTQIALGGLYFDRHNYEKAQPCYSEAVPQLPDTYANYALLKRRSDVLDELAVYSQNVNLQDSLLRLAAMPEEERLKVIDKIIEDLKKKEKEEAEEALREEYMAKQGAMGNQLTDKNQREFNINSDNSWYFYNAASKSSGKTEFQKRWGSRKLEDDWRRRNKTVFNTSDFDSDASDSDSADAQPNDSITPEQQKALEAANDPHNREFYLKQIPSSPEEISISHDIIQEGLYNMGVILKDKLDDYAAAELEFNRLLREYTDNIYRLDVYYNLYLMYMRQGNTLLAEKFRNLILSDFADSKYGMALKDPHYIDNLRKMDQVQNQLYEQTYQAYLDNDNAKVHALYEQMEKLYPMSPLMPKFMFLNALTFVTEKKADLFNALLRDMLARYPNTELAPIVSAWLKGMAQGRQLQTASDGKNMRGMLWDIHLSNDSTFAANDSIAPFEIDEEAPQMLVLVFPTDEISANALLYEVARHNFNSFVVKDFDLELMNFGRLGMLLIKGFDNFNQLNHYRRVMASASDFKLPQGVTPIAISEQNFHTLLDQGRTFDDYFRFLQEHNYEDPQAQLLAPEEIETLQEAEEAENAENIKEAENPQIENSEKTIILIDQEPINEEYQIQDTISIIPDSIAAPFTPSSESTVSSQGTPSSKSTHIAPSSPIAPITPSSPITPTPPTTPVSDPLPTGSEGEDDPLLQ